MMDGLYEPRIDRPKVAWYWIIKFYRRLWFKIAVQALLQIFLLIRTAGFNFFTFIPYTFNFSFRVRAAYELMNVSNFDHRITYDQRTEKRSYLMQSVVSRILSNLLLLLTILLRKHTSKKFFGLAHFSDWPHWQIYIVVNSIVVL